MGLVRMADIRLDRSDLGNNCHAERRPRIPHEHARLDYLLERGLHLNTHVDRAGQRICRSRRQTILS